MKKRIIIVGKGGSGKDHMRKVLQDEGFKYCVSHTTRPPRKDEIEGLDYYFINLNQAINEYILPDKFYEFVVFNEWIYGTSKEQFLRSNLFIMTPSGISKLKPIDREESLIVYLDIEENMRKHRISLRKDADDVERRLNADRLDFENFSDFDVKITDPFFRDLNYLIDQIVFTND